MEAAHLPLAFVIITPFVILCLQGVSAFMVT